MKVTLRGATKATKEEQFPYLGLDRAGRLLLVLRDGCVTPPIRRRCVNLQSGEVSERPEQELERFTGQVELSNE